MPNTIMFGILRNTDIPARVYLYGQECLCYV